MQSVTTLSDAKADWGLNPSYRTYSLPFRSSFSTSQVGPELRRPSLNPELAGLPPVSAPHGPRGAPAIHIRLRHSNDLAHTPCRDGAAYFCPGRVCLGFLSISPSPPPLCYCLGAFSPTSLNCGFLVFVWKCFRVSSPVSFCPRVPCPHSSPLPPPHSHGHLLIILHLAPMPAPRRAAASPLDAVTEVVNDLLFALMRSLLVHACATDPFAFKRTVAPTFARVDELANTRSRTAGEAVRVMH